MTSVVIAAHNEEAVIGACLDSLLSQTNPLDPHQIVVSANACSDRTTVLAEGRGVIVVERAEPGKAAAINAAEPYVDEFPRLYLDADIVVPANACAAVARALESEGVLAAVPRRRLNTVGRSWLVRAYFSINERLPAFTDGLFGRGMIAVSAAGRARFDQFPELVADDLFLDSLFVHAEKAVVPDLEVVVEAPFTVGDLLRRLVRVRRGNTSMRAAAHSGEVVATVRASDRGAWVRVVRADLRLLPAAIPYAAITLVAARRARRTDRSPDWGRDDSTRRPLGRSERQP